MPIRMGIMCENCGTVFFVASASRDRIRFDSQVDAYRLICASPCKKMRLFQRAEIRAYSVAMDVFRLGYARRDEYEEVPLNGKDRGRPCATKVGRA
jgi:hypothetical protein